MLNLPEIIIVLVIIAIVFGFGKVGKIGANLGRAKKEFQSGFADDASKIGGEREVIDITPGEETGPSWDPKPGAREQAIDDAEIDASDDAGTALGGPTQK